VFYIFSALMTLQILSIF